MLQPVLLDVVPAEGPPTKKMTPRKKQLARKVKKTPEKTAT